MGFMSMTVALSTTVWLDSSVTARVQGQWIAHCSPMTRVLPGAMEDGMGDPLFFFFFHMIHVGGHGHIHLVGKGEVWSVCGCRD